MAKFTKTEIVEALKDYGVLTKKDMPVIFQEYGVATKSDLHTEILASEKRTDLKLANLKTEIKKDLTRLERSLTIKITKSKNDLADRIANLAVAKEERSKVERIEKRVTTLENFVYA